VHDRREWRQADIYDNAKVPAPVSDAEGRTTPFGTIDLLGNVWEWCSLDGDLQAEIERMQYDRPLRIQDNEPEISSLLELRGGSYLDNLTRSNLPLALPFCPVWKIPDREECRHSDLGFRVATTIPISTLPSEVSERVLRGFDLTSAEWTSGGSPAIRDSARLSFGETRPAIADPPHPQSCGNRHYPR